MMYKIQVDLGCFAPEVQMLINVPYGCDPIEYIDQFLDGVLNEDLRYNTDWYFCEEIDT